MPNDKELLKITEGDLSGTCQDWLTDEAAAKFIEGNCTHLSFEEGAAKELIEAEVISFPSGGKGVLLGETIAYGGLEYE